MKKQLLSILLVVAMVISVMPVSVFAEDITSGSSQTAPMSRKRPN